MNHIVEQVESHLQQASAILARIRDGTASPVQEEAGDDLQPVLEISGHTYMLRRQIKALGGYWSPGTRSWLVPGLSELPESLAEAQGIETSVIYLPK